MPELPDIEDYLRALRIRVQGQPLEQLRLVSFNLLRTVDPPVSAIEGEVVTGLRRLGKRIVFEFGAVTDGPLFAVLHLMIAGRLRWRDRGAAVPRRLGLAAFDFPEGTLLLTEAGTKKRASLHLERGEDDLARHDRGGIDPLTADLEAFTAAVTEQNRTLKRALTDQRRLSGIGNAFSDEILHAAGLSPVKRSQQLSVDELARLHHATRQVLADWVERLREATGDGFPEEVTAFREGFAAHGRFGQPCPVCGTEIQRIRYADNETNYCPRCQTGGKVLADRSLSRLLKDDWPRTVEELED
ncbi:MAG: DNA-formamidopyrimidine glycosylase family protein [Nitriliruptorales bacterium]|nr:DNA-formamidopyrimidine glycosylase family protein [Nitriliruptorales bacterium]